MESIRVFQAFLRDVIIFYGAGNCNHREIKSNSFLVLGKGLSEVALLKNEVSR